jgi:uncharacterized damage-inducible protein DinB
LDELDEYRQKLLDRYAQVVDDFADFLDHFPEERLDQPQGSDGWSVHSILAHVRDMEASAFLPRLELLLEQEQPYLERYDERQWLQENNPPKESVQEILESYRCLRERELSWLKDMEPEGWSRTGRHPTWGLRTLQWWVERSLVHALGHLEALQELA